MKTPEEYEEQIAEMQSMIDEQFIMLDGRKEEIKDLKSALDQIKRIVNKI